MKEMGLEHSIRYLRRGCGCCLDGLVGESQCVDVINVNAKNVLANVVVNSYIKGL